MNKVPENMRISVKLGGVKWYFGKGVGAGILRLGNLVLSIFFRKTRYLQ